MQVEIQGILCSYRDLRESTVTEDGELIEGEEILYADLRVDEQYFNRIEHPFSEADIIEQSNLLFDERAAKYSAIQKSWVEREEKRMTYGEGVYAMIGGELTYIPASYWGYINQWTLEDGSPIEYREPDRIVCILFEYLCFETDVLALLRGKGRRMGATSLGFYLMWWICGREKEKKGGSISYNDTAADKNFKTMFMRGFKAVLPCFVRDFDSRAETFVKFAKPAEKAKIGTLQKVAGLNSFCDYLANSVNAYDSGRLSFGLFDETGKYEKTDVNTFWSKVTPTLKKGKKKVGFAYMPSTVNPKNKGGENFEKFWNESDQNEINKNTGEPYGLNTRHKVVRYFQPAYEGYAGCIDKFGRSVIDDPPEPIMGNDGEWITEGARTIILKERALKEGEQLMEHRRDYPLDIYDMFAFASGNCEFNEENIQNTINYNNDHPEESYWRQSRLVIKKETEKAKTPIGKDITKRSINPMDDAKGGWFILEPPNEANKFTDRGGYLEPNNILYQIGVDTTQDRIAVSGSNPAITVFKKSHIVDGEEKGMYPVALWISPTRLDIHFDEEVLKACMWYGCKANYEIDRRTDFYRYFCKEQCQAFLTWTPTIMKNPLKPNKTPEYGSRSGDPFQLAQMLQISKWYMDGDSQVEYNGHCHRIRHNDVLKQALHYDHLDRTKSDIFVSLQMALVAVFGEMAMPKKLTSGTPIRLLRTYKIKMTG